MKIGSKRHQASYTAFEGHRKRYHRVTLIPLIVLIVLVLLSQGVARAQNGQYPLLDAAANKVIQKYQNSSCQQLWQERQQPRSEMQDRVVNFLRSDPQMRQMFIDRVAAPVANKMFECGMIP
jgi:hypothetical protein